MKGRKWTRFSFRALLGTLTLVCVSLASWNVCKQLALRDVKTASDGWSPEVVAPYLLRVKKSDNVTVVTTFHAWIFGMICDLPYSRRSPETSGFCSLAVHVSSFRRRNRNCLEAQHVPARTPLLSVMQWGCDGSHRLGIGFR